MDQSQVFKKVIIAVIRSISTICFCCDLFKRITGCFDLVTDKGKSAHKPKGP